LCRTESIVNDPFKEYRKRFRAWRKLKGLEREERYYDRKFAVMGLGIPDDECIGRKIAKRYGGIERRPKGDLRILAIYHHYNWENESLKPSLQRFGPVRHIDWPDETERKEMGRGVAGRRRSSHALVDEVERWMDRDGVDVVFTYLSGENITGDAVQRMAALGAPIVNLYLNDKEDFVGKIRNGQAGGSRDICRFFALCWTSTEDALKKYCVEGALPIYLPEGANPDIHKPYDLEKSIDVSFVGQCYGYRPAIVRKLKDVGIQVEVFGDGWPNGPLSTTEMIRMYSKSRINLGFGGVGGFADVYCLKGRDFEIPMSGGLYLTEHHPELERWYDVGKEIVTYRDFEDLVAKIRYLLSNDEAAEDIRARGYRRARSEHTWEKRFEKVFTLMGLL
jgi:spore maturation protein CgeB